MTSPKVTVAIPTFNRYTLLLRAINSVLQQTFSNFELLIVDNASTDATKNLPLIFSDPRFRYIRNEENLGIIGNWNRAIELSKGEYIIIFHDDDIMYPTLLERSVSALDDNPTVGFTFCLLRRVDLNGNFLSLWCEDYKVSGKISGIRYLEITLEKERCISMAPCMLFRKIVHNNIGLYKQVYGHNSFDLNMYIQIALQYDVYFINEVLFDYTIHKQQMSERHWRTPESPSGPIGLCLELLSIISALMKRDYAQNINRRNFLSEKMDNINHKLVNLISKQIPDI